MAKVYITSDARKAMAEGTRETCLRRFGADVQSTGTLASVCIRTGILLQPGPSSGAESRGL